MWTCQSGLATRYSSDAGRSTATFTALAAVVLAVILGVIALAIHASKTSGLRERARLAQDQQAYLSQVSISDVRMSVAESYLGTSTYYLDANVSNRGIKTLQAIDVQLEFMDPFKQVVLRDTAHPVTPASAPLKPGETRAFRLTYERISAEWNQGLPRIIPVYVKF